MSLNFSQRAWLSTPLVRMASNSENREKVSELCGQAVELAGEKGALLEVEAAMKSEVERLEARVSKLIGQ